MKAEHLRIGNLVWDDYSGEMIVCGVISGGINPRVELRKAINLPAGSYTVDNIQPIPLTEEWLKRFGFVEPDGRDGYGGLLSPQFNGSRIRVKDNAWMCYETMVRLDYVHQLQNLYFALTGEELKLN